MKDDRPHPNPLLSEGEGRATNYVLYPPPLIPPPRGEGNKASPSMWGKKCHSLVWPENLF
jgi:hypothetical protein